jgi:tetratricopeptide (TPR) repeat protein
MINNDVDIVYNDCNIVDEELNFISRMRSEGVYEKQEDFYCMLLFRQIIPMPPSIMLKRKCFEDGYYYNTKYRNAEDYELIIRLAAIYKFGYLPEALYLYRRHEGNLTNNHKLQLKRELEVMNEIGLSKIHQIVQQSSFSENEKKMIYTKILVKMQEYIGAKEILEQLVLAECDNYSAWFYLGNCNYYLGDFPSAEKAYEKAIKFSPDMAEAYNNLACTIAHIDSHRSRELLDKAVTLKLNYMDAESNINTLKVGGKDFKITNRELRRTLTCYR